MDYLAEDESRLRPCSATHPERTGFEEVSATVKVSDTQSRRTRLLALRWLGRRRLGGLAVGWRHTPLEDDVVGTRYRWQTSELELTFVEDRDGTVVVPR